MPSLVRFPRWLFVTHKDVQILLDDLGVKLNTLLVLLASDSLKVEKCQAVLIVDLRKGLSSVDLALLV